MTVFFLPTLFCNAEFALAIGFAFQRST